tara:strand:- start:1 stop:174 length:174 start_codon:yes stop_codon:yes gene_type:complete
VYNILAQTNLIDKEQLWNKKMYVEIVVSVASYPPFLIKNKTIPMTLTVNLNNKGSGA